MSEDRAREYRLMKGTFCPCGHTRNSHAPGQCVGCTGGPCDPAAERHKRGTCDCETWHRYGPEHTP